MAWHAFDDSIVGVIKNVYSPYTRLGSGPIESTLYLVGKGITYDTGGADIKAGGIMAGMHRDKCGAATVSILRL